MLNSAVILAGGKSSRMGEDKALMPFGGYNSMAEYQYRRLQELFEDLYLSAKENKFDFDAKVILDKFSQSSPMVAIASILEELNSDFFLISVDIPLLSLQSIKSLIDVYNKEQSYEIYTFKTPNGFEPTASIYTKKILNKLFEAIDKNEYKLVDFFAKCKVKSIDFNNIEEFINVNKREDFEVAKSKLSVNKM